MITGTLSQEQSVNEIEGYFAGEKRTFAHRLWDGQTGWCSFETVRIAFRRGESLSKMKSYNRAGGPTRKKPAYPGPPARSVNGFRFH